MSNTWSSDTRCEVW